MVAASESFDAEDVAGVDFGKAGGKPNWLAWAMLVFDVFEPRRGEIEKLLSRRLDRERVGGRVENSYGRSLAGGAEGSFGVDAASWAEMSCFERPSL